MGSVSVSSCRCCMFVSCVHPVEVLNAAFCGLITLIRDNITFTTTDITSTINSDSESILNGTINAN